MAMNDRVEVNHRVCHGKPVIRGTRVPVSIIVGSLSGGMSSEEIQAEYEVSHDDILAALEYVIEEELDG
jgi:uncharacterized protein (DUF433 family)